MQPVRQFADCNGNAARAEIIAPPDQAGNLRVAEQPLDFPFLGRVALLHLCTACFQRLYRMRLRRACCAAAAVAARTPAQKDDDVARLRFFPYYVFCRGGAHYGADFHTLCSIAVMIYFMHLARCKADLVSI